MPASLEGVMSGARTWMRDHPKFFSAAMARQTMTRTFKLPHANIITTDLSVMATDNTLIANGFLEDPMVVPSASVFTYYLDEREGALRIARDRTGGMPSGWWLSVEGYYCEWVSDLDLRFHANNVIAEHAYERGEGFDFDHVPDAEEDAMALGTAVAAFTSILAEVSRDIDINTPEGIGLPLTQRFRQISELLYGAGGLKAQYDHKASMLGVGINKVMVGTLRRVSRTTGRLVPVYEPLEYDDARRPTRVFPRVDRIAPRFPPPDFEVASNITYDENGNPEIVYVNP